LSLDAIFLNEVQKREIEAAPEESKGEDAT